MYPSNARMSRGDIYWGGRAAASGSPIQRCSDSDVSNEIFAAVNIWVNPKNNDKSGFSN